MLELLFDAGWPAWLLLIASILFWAFVLERLFTHFVKRRASGTRDKS